MVNFLINKKRRIWSWGKTVLRKKSQSLSNWERVEEFFENVGRRLSVIVATVHNIYNIYIKKEVESVGIVIGYKNHKKNL